MERGRSRPHLTRQIVTLAGGVGAAKFIRGLVRRIDPERLTVVVNTGDDEAFYGLHVSPDIDTVTYTLAGVVNRAQGWGLDGESFNVLPSLARFYGTPWFGLGDRDLATHLYRTDRMHQGAPLSQITAEVARAFSIKSRILPMSDDRVRTFVKLRGRPAIPFQEYFVHRRARGVVEKIELRGIRDARPAPGLLQAIRKSAAIILAPSNPFVSLGPILQLSGVREALGRVKSRVAAISPIVGGRTIKGPADKMLRGLGMEVSPLGVARLYRDIASVFVLDNADRRYIPEIEQLGMRAIATDIIMTTPERAARLSEAVLRELEV
ncbi:MAG: 2-phospho-L-lactate transferase, partial [Candidatus Binataceae bacterium]|nr:2-phospho-L-lactate transferase [Candidatus Binataceae bacterium]